MMPIERFGRLVQRSCSLPTLIFSKTERKALTSAWTASVITSDRINGRDFRRFHTSTGLMVPQKDYYAILGVTKSSQQADIKKAYYALAKKYHPDVNTEKNQSMSQMRFQDIQEAYEVLGDERKRRKYDIENGGVYPNKSSNPRSTSQPGTGERRKPRYYDHPINRNYDYQWRYEFRYYDDPKSNAQQTRRFNKTFDFFGMMNNAFSMLRDFPQFVDETDKIAGDVVLSFEEAALGVEKEISYKTAVPCSGCGGQGRTQFGSERCTTCGGTGNFTKTHNVSAPCFVCFGTGYLPSSKVCLECRGSGNAIKKRSVKIKIPPGVKHQQRIEVKVPDGKAKIRVLIKKSKNFDNSGYDVHTETFVTSQEAIHGAVKKIHTLDGDIDVHIPKGTWTGRMIELKGYGLPRADRDSRGSLIVHVRVQG